MFKIQCLYFIYDLESRTSVKLKDLEIPVQDVS